MDSVGLRRANVLPGELFLDEMDQTFELFTYRHWMTGLRVNHDDRRDPYPHTPHLLKEGVHKRGTREHDLPNTECLNLSTSDR